METTVSNMPPAWPFVVIAISQIVFAAAMAIVALVLIGLMRELMQIVKELQGIVRDDVHRDIMPSVTATLKNVKEMSDDAKVTTHNVTGTVNRVSHVASSVVGRLESPLVRSVGVLTGVAAVVRAITGGGRKEVIVQPAAPKRRGGLLGLFKK
jgi:hypothetical protein